MARRKNTDPAAPPSARAEREAVYRALSEAYDDGDDVVSHAFQFAMRLAAEKRELLERIAASRRLLRDLATAGLANPAHVDALYPPKGAGHDAIGDVAADDADA